MTDAVIGLWDTEWSPATTYTWTSRPKYLPNDMLVEEARLLCYGAKYLGKKTVVVDERIGRKEMLVQLRDWLDTVDLLISYNGQAFDTKKVNSEFMREGITPPAPYKEVDLYRVIRQNSSFYSGKLAFIGDALVGETKVPTGGFDLWRGVMAGDEASWRKMRRYQKGDVDLLEKLFEVLKPWIRMPHPVTDKSGLVCRNCGGTHLQSRGTSKTLQGEYPRFQCVGCGAWMRGPQRTAVGDTRSV